MICLYELVFASQGCDFTSFSVNTTDNDVKQKLLPNVYWDIEKWEKIVQGFGIP